MNILSADTYSFKELKEGAIQTLRAGGLVIAPSDTVYGASVDATNKKAVEKLIKFKARPAGKPISVFVGDLEEGKKYVEISKTQESMLQNILPGPYTIVLPSKHTLVKNLEAEDGTLGIRNPDFQLSNDIVHEFGSPITATSANLAGRSPHYSVASLLNSLPQKKKDMIDLIIDYGKLSRNKPSTVVYMGGGTIDVLRQGDVKIDPESKIHISKSAAETQKIAIDIYNAHKELLKKKPLVILLYGELGAGKTVFVKGIGKELGLDRVVSPTFVIFYEYPVKGRSEVKNLYHFDLYKLNDSSEFNELGIEDLLRPHNLFCVEWSEKSSAILESLQKKAHVIKVSLEHVNESTRKICIQES